MQHSNRRGGFALPRSVKSSALRARIGGVTKNGSLLISIKTVIIWRIGIMERGSKRDSPKAHSAVVSVASVTKDASITLLNGTGEFINKLLLEGRGHFGSREVERKMPEICEIN